MIDLIEDRQAVRNELQTVRPRRETSAAFAIRFFLPDAAALEYISQRQPVSCRS
jgi:hypothetical protein